MKLSKRVKFLEAEVAELRNALVKLLAVEGFVQEEVVARAITIINASGVPVLKLRADDDDGGVISVHNADGGGVILIGVTPDGGIFSVATSEGLPRGVFYCEGDTGKICVITGSGSTTRLAGGESVSYDPDGVHRHIYRVKNDLKYWNGGCQESRNSVHRTATRGAAQVARRNPAQHGPGKGAPCHRGGALP